MSQIEKPDVIGATRRAETIRAGMVGYVEAMAAIGEAYEQRDWVTLGHKDWDTYCEKEFSGKRLKLSRDERELAVLAFRGAGMSIRAIGSALGVSHPTVLNDLRSGGQDLPPGDITGTDGKTYPASQPAADTAGPESQADTEPAEPQAPVDSPQPSGPAAQEEREVDPFAGWSDEERALLKRLEDGGTIVLTYRGAHDRLVSWAESAGLLQRIDRRTEWGNPFEMPADGDRETVIANFEAHYLPFKPSLLAKLKTLRGKALGCWCAPEECHGHILADWAEREDLP
jgi:hypothetical protein